MGTSSTCRVGLYARAARNSSGGLAKTPLYPRLHDELPDNTGSISGVLCGDVAWPGLKAGCTPASAVVMPAAAPRKSHLVSDDI